MPLILMTVTATKQVLIKLITTELQQLMINMIIRQEVTDRSKNHVRRNNQMSELWKRN